MTTDSVIAALADRLWDVALALHADPELAFDEHRAADRRRHLRSHPEFATAAAGSRAREAMLAAHSPPPRSTFSANRT